MLASRIAKVAKPPERTRRVVSVDGIEIHWTEMGRGRPIVLLHGVCDSHRTWRKVAPTLAQTRRVLMPDLPGHGLSGRPDASYEAEWYAQVMGAWLDALRLKRFDLVGHSFGGGVAQLLLMTHGARVRRLALVAAGGLGREVNIGLRLASIRGVVERVGQRFMASGTRLGMAAVMPTAEPEEVEILGWMNAMPGTARAFSRTLGHAIDWGGQRQNFFARAHELQSLPALALFWGDRDTVIPVEHGAEMALQLDGVCMTRFDACGHFPHLEQPEKFARALTDFVDAPKWEIARHRGAPQVVRRHATLARIWIAFAAFFQWVYALLARAGIMRPKHLSLPPP